MGTDNPEELARAMDLEGRLYRAIGNPKGIDVLCEYRRWLDAQKISAEVDGWPSPEAYDQANVQAFAEYWLG